MKTAVDARFGSAGLLMADLAQARREQTKMLTNMMSTASHPTRTSIKFSSSSTLRNNQNATNVGVGDDAGAVKDDEWMRMMKRRVEKRAAAATMK